MDLKKKFGAILQSWLRSHRESPGPALWTMRDVSLCLSFSPAERSDQTHVPYPQSRSPEVTVRGEATDGKVNANYTSTGLAVTGGWDSVARRLALRRAAHYFSSVP